MIRNDDVSHAAARGRRTPQINRPADAAVRLMTLAGDLQQLGFPYEAYQLREAATRLLRGSAIDANALPQSS